MQKLATKFNDTFIINVPTPDGSLWVHIVKNDDGSIHKIFTNAGKCGASFNAWAAAYAHLLSLFIEQVVQKDPNWTLNRLVSEISGFMSDKFRDAGRGIKIYSGPEGIAFAIRQYQQDLVEKQFETLKAKRNEGRIRLKLG